MLTFKQSGASGLHIMTHDLEQHVDMKMHVRALCRLAAIDALAELAAAAPAREWRLIEVLTDSRAPHEGAVA